MLVNTDISGETKLRRLVCSCLILFLSVVTYSHFEYCIVWDGSSMYVVKRSI